MDEYVDGQWRDAGVLPKHLRKLHNRQQAAIRQEREQRDDGWAEAERVALEEELETSAGPPA